MRVPHNQRGFSLIEILIVVAIIANFVAGNPLAAEPATLGESGRQITGGMTVQIPR